MNPKNLMAMLQPMPQQKLMSMADDPSSDEAYADLPPAPTVEELAASLPDAAQAPQQAPPMPQQMPDIAPRSSPYEKQMFDQFQGQINDRKAMLDKLKAKLAQGEANQPTGADALDLKPFLSFADQLNGTHSAKDYDGNQTTADYRNRMEKLQAAITQGSDKLSDDQLNYLKMKSLEASRMDANDARRQFYKGLGDYRSASLGLREDQFARNAAKDITNDGTVKNLVERRQQLGRDLHTLDTAQIMTPQIFDEIQKGITNAITGARSSTVSDTASMKVNTLDQDFARLKQRLASKPEDINNPELKKYMRDLILRLDDAYQQNMSERTSQLTAGSKHLSSGKAKAMINERVNGLNASPQDSFEHLSDEELDRLVKQKQGK